MPTPTNLGQIFDFLNELNQHNQKTWFDQNRAAYETARDTFESFINEIIAEFRTSDDLQGLTARDCMARIYRDIRFSKDKRPYKTNMGAMITPGGWRSAKLGYYISIEPHGQSRVAGGLYHPSPQQLNRFRQAIGRDASPFKQIIAARDFIDIFGAVEGQRLKTTPKGYDPAHPEISLLQLKQVTAMHDFMDEEVLADDFAGRVVPPAGQ